MLSTMQTSWPGRAARVRRQRWCRSNSVLKASIIMAAMRQAGQPPLSCQAAAHSSSALASTTISRHGYYKDIIRPRSTRTVCLAEPSSRSSPSGPPDYLASGAAAAVAVAVTAQPAVQETAAGGATGDVAVTAAGADSQAALRGLASMAQLATAWAEVSSRLGSETSLPIADEFGDAAAPSHQGPREACEGISNSLSQGGAAAAGGTGGRGQEAEWAEAWPRPQHEQQRQISQQYGSSHWKDATDFSRGGPQPLGAAAGSTYTSSAPYLVQPGQQQERQHQQEQQPRPHFEAIITALKLALASLQGAPARRDGRSPATRAVQLVSTLADLCAAGLPLDASSICAGVVSEAADAGALRHDVIRAQLGPGVAALVHDMLRVREAPRRIELLDDEGASAVREWCLAFHDVRACVVEVVCWWDELQHMGGLPLFEQQALALEALQIGAPLGHALGLGALSALMEDMCLKVLFPESYTSTASWLRGLMDPAEDALFAAQQRLLAALDEHPDFGRLAGGLVVKARTKSLFSVMKKLLHLGDLSRGGRRREELYDLLGMRAVVKAPEFLPPHEAELAATKACYIVQDVACQLWRPIPSRSKDYIVAPKANGYQSLHLTLQLGQLDMSYESYGDVHVPCPAADASPRGATAPPSPSSPPPSPSSSSSTSSCDWDQLPYLANTSSNYHGSGTSPTAASTGGVPTPDVAMGGSGSPRPGLDPVAEAEAAAGGPLCLELQIRSAAMDAAAESGDAAHAVYKGGLDARTARQLQAWTQELQRRLAAQPRGRLLLRAAASSTGAEAAGAAERRRRRRERRAAATAAAAALAAAASPPPSPQQQETFAAVATEALPHVNNDPPLPLRGQVFDAGAGAQRPAPEAGASEDGVAGTAQETSLPAVSKPVAVAGAQGKLLPPPRRATGPVGQATDAEASASPSTSSRAKPITRTALAGAAAGRGRGRTADAAAGAAGASAAGMAGAAVKTSTADGSTATSVSRPSETNPACTGAAGADAGGRSDVAAVPDEAAGIAGVGVSAGVDMGVRQLPRSAGQHGYGRPIGSAAALASSAAGSVGDSDGNLPRTPPSLSPPSSLQQRQQSGCKTISQGHSYKQDSKHLSSHQHQQHTHAQGQQDQQDQQQQDDQQQQQRLMLFSSLGSIDDPEDAPLLIGLGQRDAAAAAAQLFLHLDVNRDGRLSLGEVRQAVMDLAAPASEGDAAALMAALDANGDGGVSLEEFVEGLGRAQLHLDQHQSQGGLQTPMEAQRRAQGGGWSQQQLP